METLLQTCLVVILIAFASILFFVYIDSVENCWRYTTRRIDLEEDELLFDNTQNILFPQQYTTPYTASPSAIVYCIFLILGIIPIVNTMLLLHSMKPFFDKVNLKNDYQRTSTYIQNLFAENTEYRSKLYQSSVVYFIAKWYYGINAKILF
jgi:flagellar biosynthesis protein FlhB